MASPNPASWPTTTSSSTSNKMATSNWPTRLACLVVDNFVVKYVGEEHARHLIELLQRKYTITIDWSGDLYVGLNLDWDYTNRTVEISMPNYVAKALLRFNHAVLNSHHTSAPPRSTAPKSN
jgi:hypothetical protein